MREVKSRRLCWPGHAPCIELVWDHVAGLVTGANFGLHRFSIKEGTYYISDSHIYLMQKDKMNCDLQITIFFLIWCSKLQMLKAVVIMILSIIQCNMYIRRFIQPPGHVFAHKVDTL